MGAVAVRPLRFPAGFQVWVSSYQTPNHQTNEKANSGDLVMDIVANTASGQHRKNTRIRNRARPPASWGAASCAMRALVVEDTLPVLEPFLSLVD